MSDYHSQFFQYDGIERINIDNLSQQIVYINRTIDYVIQTHVCEPVQRVVR